MKRQIATALGWNTSRLMLNSFFETLGSGLLGIFILLTAVSIFTVDQMVNLPLAIISIVMLVMLPMLTLTLIALFFCWLTGIGITLWVLQSDLEADLYLHSEALRQRAALINIVGFPIMALCIGLVMDMAIPSIGMLVAASFIVGFVASVFATQGASEAIEHLQMRGIAPRKPKAIHEV